MTFRSIVKYQSQGCFHFINDEIEFFSKADLLYVKYNGQTKMMLADQIQLARDFEEKLKTRWDMGCTTQDH
ncbi:MAG: hypothetical protein BM555_02715 [Crocinitomix sp. MedPE-SWsnd]|nr:MAG: hypothetical protein BM555_02715 [Crocinitomix sp. MedPE-SWsnd]